MLISAGELAVGLGTLVGLFGRLAALGGMVLALTFFLTVSYNDSPYYYYGADIVFLFAWTPLLLGGSGWYSLDGLFARRAAAEAVRLPTGSAAREELARRTVLGRAGAAATLAGAGVLLGAFDVLLGRHFSPSSGKRSTSGTLPGSPVTSTTTSGSAADAPTTTAPTAGAPAGTRIGPASDVPVGGAASFTDPAQQTPAYVVQPTAGHYLAFSAVCTHAGCTVAYEKQADEFACPCHGSVFNATTGAVVSGPAPSPLPSIPIALGANGDLYVDG